MSTRPRSTDQRKPPSKSYAKSLGPEPGDDDTAIGGGGATGVSGLDVSLVAGAPCAAVRSQRIRRSACRSRQHPALRRSIVRRIAVAVETGLERRVGRLLIALVTKTTSPQTIGLECASPGIGRRHRRLYRTPDSNGRADSVSRRCRPLRLRGTMASGRCPRPGAAVRPSPSRGGARCGARPSPAEPRAATTCFRSRNIRRGVQASAIRLKLTRAINGEGVTTGAGVGVWSGLRLECHSRPLVVQVRPSTASHRPTRRMSAGSKRSVNARIASSQLGSDCCAAGDDAMRETASAEARNATRPFGKRDITALSQASASLRIPLLAGGL